VRNFAICGRTVPVFHPDNASFGALSIDAVPVLCGVVETADRVLGTKAAADRRNVLVRVHAFSCNYRDKSFVVRAASHLPHDRFFVIGSEFVGVVVATGAGVRRVRPGDRVIGDNTYPHVGPGQWAQRIPAGIPTNGASGEYLVLHEDKVLQVPRNMPDQVAASFSLGAQTAFSMVDKLAPQAGEPVLVTAARSNTSLFAIEALHRRGAVVHVTTSSAMHADRLLLQGAASVFVVDAGLPFTANEALVAAARAVGGFVAVVDPFFDLHLLKVLPLMRNGSRYVSCGFHDQAGLSPHPLDGPAPDYHAALVTAIVRNIAILGNCVGLRHHLEQAVSAFETGQVRVPVDEIFHGDDAAGFLARTFTAPDRFGKVVYAYQ
jgi:NADPH:quinone reductase-like Zn-dependent oxidoreductase